MKPGTTLTPCSPHPLQETPHCFHHLLSFLDLLKPRIKQIWSSLSISSTLTPALLSKLSLKLVLSSSYPLVVNILNWTESKLQKLEVIQNKVRRVALGANRYACVEAIRGDMGWSTFTERSMKGNIMYKLRVERMSNHSWVKKVYKDGSRFSKWTRSCKRLVRKCGLNCKEDIYLEEDMSLAETLCV